MRILLSLCLFVGFNVYSQSNSTAKSDSIFESRWKTTEILISEKNYFEAKMNLKSWLKDDFHSKSQLDSFTKKLEWVTQAANCTPHYDELVDRLKKHDPQSRIIVAKRKNIESINACNRIFYIEKPEGLNLAIEPELLKKLNADSIELFGENQLSPLLYTPNSDYTDWTPGDANTIHSVTNNKAFNGVVIKYPETRQNFGEMVEFVYKNGNVVEKKTYSSVESFKDARNTDWNIIESESWGDNATYKTRYNAGSAFQIDTTAIVDGYPIESGMKYFNNGRSEHYYHQSFADTNSSIKRTSRFENDELYYTETVFSTDTTILTVGLSPQGDTIRLLKADRNGYAFIPDGVEIGFVNYSDKVTDDCIHIYKITWEEGFLRNIEDDYALFVDREGRQVSREQFIQDYPEPVDNFWYTLKRHRDNVINKDGEDAVFMIYYSRVLDKEQFSQNAELTRKQFKAEYEKRDDTLVCPEVSAQ